MEIKIYEDERIDDLQCKGLKIIQKKNGFCFGMDAVLVADFADIRKNDIVADLGTGTGIIPVLISGKTYAKEVVGIEVQSDIAKMAKRSVRLNNLEHKVRIIEGDIKKCSHLLDNAAFNAVVTNPPYMNVGGGFVNPSDTKAVSRHELLCSLDDVLATSGRILKSNGRFAMVHRPGRLVDIMCLMRKHGIEPKYIRFVYPTINKKANLILVRGIKGGRPELKMMKPLYVYNANGEYTDEIKNIYSL